MGEGKKERKDEGREKLQTHSTHHVGGSILKADGDISH